ncbi:hypothetical protein CDD81_1425 [Ophiocordyceps australis]|uniref:Dol-P-Man:Man(5)GlcNAc(2)-PP-Dol alpha-1,3-mannosyltransferase n=1 Tax=Ophiocordyceps australis TaxID=1399860 RepID=A0A2C5XFD7_9HYPO|nr:hypothetical protein CDD81_1425 [Ophiocordyceps australis]
MPTLSPSLKALIKAPFAHPNPAAPPKALGDVYRSIARDAAQRHIGMRPWLTLSAAATVTLNSPGGLAVLHRVASEYHSGHEIQAAELIREVGLKCITFIGVPRIINCLNSFRADLPASVASQLSTRATRTVPLTTAAMVSEQARGRQLWDSVYAALADKLVAKLALAHPDLPIHIIGCHYAPLLSDPQDSGGGTGEVARTGKVLTEVAAVASLRATQGVGPQVLSHVYGLQKAWEDESWREGWVGDEAVARWLTGSEGCEWILEKVDGIMHVFAGGNPGPNL